MRSLADWLEQQQKSHPSAIDLDLERACAAWRSASACCRRAYRVITVGGTNGKGSTVACLDALLRAAGKRCGRFTSPHLVRYNERICIDGVEAGDAEPHRVLRAHRGGRADRHHAHVFRIQRARGARPVHARAVSMWRCSRWGSAGGSTPPTSSMRTSAWFARSASITSTGWAIRSSRSAARRPASFARGRPAVLGSGADARVGVAGHRWSSARAPWRPAATTTCGRTAIAGISSSATLRLRDLPLPALAGVHQVGNAATALAAIAAGGFRRRAHAGRSSRGRCARCASRGGFSACPGEVEWIFDVAHNVPAAETLRDNLRTLPRAGARWPCAEFSATRTSAGSPRRWRPRSTRGFSVTLAGPRAVAPSRLAQQLPAQRLDPGARRRCGRSAVAWRAPPPRPGDRVLVFGSFLTVGPALEFLGI